MVFFGVYHNALADNNLGYFYLNKYQTASSTLGDIIYHATSTGGFSDGTPAHILLSLYLQSANATATAYCFSQGGVEPPHYDNDTLKNIFDNTNANCGGSNKSAGTLAGGSYAIMLSSEGSGCYATSTETFSQCETDANGGWLSLTVAPYYSITLDRPVSGSTISDFSSSFWQGTFTNPAPTSTPTYFGVVFCYLTGGCAGNVLDNNTTLNTNATGTYSWLLDKNYGLANGDYRAYSAIWQAPYPFSYAIATSSYVFFTIGSSTPPVGICQTITSSSFLADPVGNIETALCQVFIPSTDQQQDLSARLTNIKNSVSTKPPVGYFTLISTALNSLQEGTTTQQLVASSTKTAFGGIFSPLFSFFEVVLWVLLATWIFHRFRLINF